MKAVQSLFLQILGDSPLLRVWDFLLEGREFEYTIREVAENIKVAPAVMKKIWFALVVKGFIVKTNKTNKQEHFKLNTENRLIKLLTVFDDALIKYSSNSGQRRAD